MIYRIAVGPRAGNRITITPTRKRMSGGQATSVYERKCPASWQTTIAGLISVKLVVNKLLHYLRTPEPQEYFDRIGGNARFYEETTMKQLLAALLGLLSIGFNAHAGESLPPDTPANL